MQINYSEVLLSVCGITFRRYLGKYLKCLGWKIKCSNVVILLVGRVEGGGLGGEGRGERDGA